MKTTKLEVFGAISILTILITGLTPSYGQTNLNFNGIAATSESAMRLSWNSTSNEVYEVDYANDLIDTNTGFTTWLRLYNHYPSHGTNTFWLDTGNYNLEPSILHPKLSPMRFYRISRRERMTAQTPSL